MFTAYFSMRQKKSLKIYLFVPIWNHQTFPSQLLHFADFRWAGSLSGARQLVQRWYLTGRYKFVSIYFRRTPTSKNKPGGHSRSLSQVNHEGGTSWGLKGIRRENRLLSCQLVLLPLFFCCWSLGLVADGSPACALVTFNEQHLRKSPSGVFIFIKFCFVYSTVNIIILIISILYYHMKWRVNLSYTEEYFTLTGILCMCIYLYYKCIYVCAYTYIHALYMNRSIQARF